MSEPLPIYSDPDADVTDEERLDALFAHVAGVPAEPDWMGLRHVVSPGFARTGRERMRAPAEIRALGVALTQSVHGRPHGRHAQWTYGVRLVSAWTADDDEARIEVARDTPAMDWAAVVACLEVEMHPAVAIWVAREERERRGEAAPFDAVQWADVGACLRSGMTADDAVTHVRSGAEMEPVRLVAALTG